MSSLPVRLLKVFYAPGEVMEEVAADPKWLGALLAGASVVVLANFLIPADVMATAMRAAIAERGGEMPPDLDRMVSVTRTFGIIGGLLFWFLFTFLIAGIATTVFAFFLGDDGAFKQYLAVVAHALIISAVGAVVVIPLRVQAQDLRLTLSIGTFLQGVLSEGYFLNVLRALDLFGLWTYAVIAVGATKIDPRRSWGSAFLVLLLVALAFAMVVAIFLGM